MDKPKCIIFDLEGTITNCDHRIHYYNKKDYDKWNKRFDEDKVNENIKKEIIEYFTSNYSIIIVTAKSEEYSNIVSKWLKKNELWGYIRRIYFRNINDSRSSVDVKKDNLDIIKRQFDIIRAYDDRQEICEMYEKNGIEAYAVQNNIFINSKCAIKVPDILEKSKQIFLDRNKKYKDSYKHFGKIMIGFFPNGIKLKTEKDFTRFALLQMLISKLDRYSKNFKEGHRDSLIDNSTYSAMLNEVDNELL